MKNKAYPLTLSECIDKILGTDSAVVAMHIRPDGDTVGTSVALCRIFEAMGKKAELASADRIPERLRFLTEDVSFTEDYAGKTVITCDVASAAQLGVLYEKLPKIDFSIDHHAVSAPFAPHFTLGDKSSAAEVVYCVLKELVSRGALSVTEQIAYPLYAAMSSDTGGFVYSSATADTYRAAAELIECGIDYADINHRLFYSKSEKQIKAEGFVAQRLVSLGNIAYAAITVRDREQLGIEAEHFDTAIDVVRSLIGVETAFTLKELDRGKYRVSLRSTGMDVARVAAKFGGGGHVRAAGCTVEAESPDVAAKLIISEITCKQ